MTKRKKRTLKSDSKKSPAKGPGLLKRIRNYFLVSIVMVFIGGAGEKYKKEIFKFASSKYQGISTYFETGGEKQAYNSTENGENKSSGERPLRKRKPSEIVRHKYYTLSYNEAREQPNWVSYTLTKGMVTRNVAKRTNDFRPDPFVKTKSADLADYRGSGYDRGHLCPAGSMAFSKEAMSETFYMSNMSPQLPGFNRGIWKNLEGRVRYWAIRNKELQVVTGPIFLTNKQYKEIGHDKVDVPDAFYKVILDKRKPGIKAIGFIIPNKKTYKSPCNYAVSVDTVERTTGMDFFSSLPDSVENKIEAESNYKKWVN